MPRRAACSLAASRWSVPPQGASCGSCPEASTPCGSQAARLQASRARAASMSDFASAPSRRTCQRPSALEVAQIDDRGGRSRQLAAVEHQIGALAHLGRDFLERPRVRLPGGVGARLHDRDRDCSKAPRDASGSRGTRRPRVSGSVRQAAAKRWAGFASSSVSGPGSSTCSASRSASGSSLEHRQSGSRARRT